MTNNKSQCPVEPTVRITRARAKSLGLHPPSKPDEEALRTKRTAPEKRDKEEGSLKKKRKVEPYFEMSPVPGNKSPWARAESLGLPPLHLLSKPDEKASACPEKRVVLKDVKIETPTNVQDKEEGPLKKKRKVEPSCETIPVPGNKRETKMNDKKKEESMDDVIDVDSKHDDPLMFSLYANDIYYYMHTAQLARRPLVDYIEKVQRDISQDKRAILIDWLIEASDDCRMLPDTIYLTVNLIDRFLSHTSIEEQKLELLGITCFVIASKYEDTRAPRLQDLHKEEVLQMERCLLKLLGFQLSVPTTKKFLRRFIQASHASCKAPCAELEFLANYLADLTLTEYIFLKFLPSQIAASAVFLARWTLDQSQHPWNPTLEHYTRHKSPELKMAVLELQELQLNARGCKTVREKYSQSEFMSVSTLRSSKLAESLF